MFSAFSDCMVDLILFPNDFSFFLLLISKITPRGGKKENTRYSSSISEWFALYGYDEK